MRRPGGLARRVAVMATTFAAFGAGGGSSASLAAEPAGSKAGRLLVGVATPDVPGSARRDFELSIARGLRFSGFDVITESVASGSAPALVTCAAAACLSEVGTARGVGTLARATVEAAPPGARDSTKRTYSMKIEVFSAPSGQAILDRRTTCEACPSDVAAHLGYLLAIDVGQRLVDLRRSATAVPAGRPAPQVRLAAKEPSPAATASAHTSAADLTSAGQAAHPVGRTRATTIGAAVLGGLGLAALTTGTVLWVRGPQSTCPDRPASLCGRTYDDAPVGQLLTGLGAAALAGAIVWWVWSPAPEPTVRPTARVALVPGGLVASGRF